MTLHYAAGGGIESNGQFSAGQYGFNLADVQSVEQLNALPPGVKGLVWLDQAKGVTQSFINEVQQYIGNPKLYGFYLADEPDPTGKWGPLVKAEDLKAESDWIHANAPGAKTFIVMMDMGSSTSPNFTNTYNPANTHIDYFGIDPYPVRSGSGQVDYSMIGKAVAAAVKAGIPVDQIVPVYQTFGGGGWTNDQGGKYVMPTAQQAQTMISEWAKYAPSPAFDYAYHWESQNGDTALQNSPALLQIFLSHNSAAGSPGSAITPPPIDTQPPATGQGSPGGGSSTGSPVSTTNGAANGSSPTGDSHNDLVHSIVGQTMSADDVSKAMAAIKAGVMSVDDYLDQVIAQVQHTTLPALVVSQFFGSSPSEAHLTELSAFSATQLDLYTTKGVLDPALGPYEALGVGFSDVSSFANRYGSMSDSDFIGKAYQDVFGRAATTNQAQHFAEQIRYFEQLYGNAGQTATQADLHAKGAALGQMLGVAVIHEPSLHAYDDAASAFLRSAAKGQAQYGDSIVM